ncbi:MAG: hypothetical protein IT285_12165 [Bdellovibrionales bacterium]|nr:hypothetical protein [Bdellovibrionales bacterium]
MTPVLSSRVLLVISDAFASEAVGNQLLAAGIGPVVRVPTAFEAVARVLQESFDCLVMDQNLEFMGSPVQVMAAIRERTSANCATPVVLIHDPFEVSLPGLMEGVTERVPKPVTPDRLAEAVRRAVRAGVRTGTGVRVSSQSPAAALTPAAPAAKEAPAPRRRRAA